MASNVPFCHVHRCVRVYSAHMLVRTCAYPIHGGTEQFSSPSEHLLLVWDRTSANTRSARQRAKQTSATHAQAQAQAQAQSQAQAQAQAPHAKPQAPTRSLGGSMHVVVSNNSSKHVHNNQRYNVNSSGNGCSQVFIL